MNKVRCKQENYGKSRKIVIIHLCGFPEFQDFVFWGWKWIFLKSPLHILNVYWGDVMTQLSPNSFTCHWVISLLPNTYSIKPSSVLKLKPATWYNSSATGKFFLRRLYFVFVVRACISSVEQMDFKRRSLQHAKIKFTFEEYYRCSAYLTTLLSSLK